MRKFAMAMVGILLAGVAGVVWAEALNPQPLPPGAKGPAGGNLTLHDKNQISGNLNGDGQLTKGLHKDAGFIKKAPANGFHKGEGFKKNRASITDGTSKAGINGDGHNLNGDGKAGTQKVLIGLNKANNFKKARSPRDANSFQKNGAMGDGSTHVDGGTGGKAGFQDLHHNGNGTQKVLIGLDKANSFQKSNGLQKNGSFQKNGAMGDGSVHDGANGVVIQGGTQAEGQ